MLAPELDPALAPAVVSNGKPGAAPLPFLRNPTQQLIVLDRLAHAQYMAGVQKWPRPSAPSPAVVPTQKVDPIVNHVNGATASRSSASSSSVAGGCRFSQSSGSCAGSTCSSPAITAGIVIGFHQTVQAMATMPVRSRRIAAVGARNGIAHRTYRCRRVSVPTFLRAAARAACMNPMAHLAAPRTADQGHRSAPSVRRESWC